MSERIVDTNVWVVASSKKCEPLMTQESMKSFFLRITWMKPLICQNTSQKVLK